MESRRPPYRAARTATMLNRLPGWIKTGSDSAMFRYLNVVGQEVELAEQAIINAKRELSPLNMDPYKPANLYRVDNIPKVNYSYYGVTDNGTFPLTVVQDEKKFLDNIPSSRASLVMQTEIDAQVLNLRYIEGMNDGDAVYAALVCGHPSDTGALRTIAADGSLVSSDERLGVKTQSYAEVGIDEELKWYGSTATLRNFPVAGTVHVYDILNLTEDLPTEITDFTISGKTLTWTGDNSPNSRYIVEYDYAAYLGLRSMIPSGYRWGIGYNPYDFLNINYLQHDEYTYSPATDDSLNTGVSHQIVANTKTKSPIILDYETRMSEGSASYFLKLFPHEIRAGRSITVNMKTTDSHSVSWNNASNLTVDMTSVDELIISTAAGSIQIIDADDLEITSQFIIEVQNGTNVIVHSDEEVTAPGPYTVTIYYTYTLTETKTCTSASTYTDDADYPVYYTEVDVTDMVVSSLVLPEQDDFECEVAVEYIAKVESPATLYLDETAYTPDVYLERYNQALHFRDVDNPDREFITLLNLIRDDDGIYRTDINGVRLWNEVSEAYEITEGATWDYRDMIQVKDSLYLLKTEINSSDTSYLPRSSGSGESVIELFSIYGLTKRVAISGLPANGVSITYGPHRRLHLVSHIQTDVAGDNLTSLLSVFQLNYDYVLLSENDEDYTAYVSSDITALRIVASDDVSTDYTPVTHDIWNALDEWGLVFGVSRFPGETNLAYRTRLQAVASYSHGSSRQGLVNAISTRLGLTRYKVTEQRHFYLTYKPEALDADLQDLSITVTVEDAVQIQQTTDTWDNASSGYIIWPEHDGTYGQLLEFKNAPAENTEIVVTYSTLENDSYLTVQDTFIGSTAETPGSDQVEVYELTDPSFIETFQDETGKVGTDYYALLEEAGKYYKRTWGDFEWDTYRWDDGTRLNTIATNYDIATLPVAGNSNPYINGSHGHALKLAGISPAGEPELIPGYFYVDGVLHYLYANKTVLELDPNDYPDATIQGAIPLTASFTNKAGEQKTVNVHPSPGTPVAATRGDLPNQLIIGYSGHFIVPADDPLLRQMNDPGDASFKFVGDNIAEVFNYPQLLVMSPRTTSTAEGHTHTWSFNNNLVDAAKMNGYTSTVDGHYHEIAEGAVQSAGTPPHTHTLGLEVGEVYGYWNPTPNALRKRVSDPESFLTDKDYDYFATEITPAQTAIRLYGDRDDPVVLEQFRQIPHRLEYETGGKVHQLSGPAAPMLDSNHYHISRTFLGIGASLPIDSLTVYASKTAVSLSQTTDGIVYRNPLGISILAVDTQHGRTANARVTVEAPADTYLGQESAEERKHTVDLGYTEVDGTLYGQILLTDVPAGTVAGDTITLTIKVFVETSEEWNATLYTQITSGEDVIRRVYVWETQLEVIYNG